MIPQVNKVAEKDNHELRNYFQLVRKSLWWLLCFMAIAVFIAFLFNRYTVPIYRFNAVIMVKAKDANLTTKILYGSDIYNPRQELMNHANILKSFLLIKKALTELNFNVSYFRVTEVREVEIYKNTPFYIQYDSVMNASLNDQTFKVTILDHDKFNLKNENKNGITLDTVYHFGQNIFIDSFRFKLILIPDFPPNQLTSNTFLFRFNKIQSLAYQYKNELKVEPIDKESSVLSITLEAAMPDKQIDFINKLIEIYLRENMDEKNRAVTNTIKYIDAELLSISNSMGSIENRLERFKSDKKIFDISQEAQKIFADLTALESQKAEFIVKENYYSYLQKYIKNKNEFENIVSPSSLGVEDPLLNKLIMDLVALQLEKNTFIDQGSLKNPAIKEINDKITNLIAALLENLNNIKSSNQIQIDNIHQRINEAVTAAKGLPKSEIEFVNINRMYKQSESIYLFLEEKRVEAGITKSSNAPDSKIVEPAMLESITPLYPKRSINYILAILVGFIVPFIIIIMKDYMNDTVRNKKELSMLNEIPLLGMVGHEIGKNPHPLAVKNPKSFIAESFRSLHTNLLFFAKEKKNKIFLITSYTQNEGKTFCSVNLASIIAMSGKKTLLISADLRKPKAHEYFEIEKKHGLTTFLINNIPLAQIIQKTFLEKLDFIASGQIPPNPAELLMSNTMKEMIEKLKELYDVIIIDSPPFGLVADSLSLMPLVDLNIVIVRENHTKRENVKFINEEYMQGKIKNPAIILNDAKMDYGYGYSYNYYEEDNGSKNFLSRFVRLFKKN